MKISIFLLLATGVSLLFLSHLFLYLTLVKFFTINSLFLKRIFLASALVLSFSFFATSILAHSSNIRFFKWAYAASSAWYGFLVNFLLVSIFLWLVFLISRNLGWQLEMSWLAAVLLLFAAGLSIYGIWNAQNPVIRTIEVSIPDLPEKWQGRSVVHISDVHLGAVNKEKFMDRIVDRINQEKPKAVFITGDYFDGTCRRFRDLASPLTRLKATSFFVYGNHEIYAGKNDIAAALQARGINILMDRSVDLDGLEIVGLDYPNRDSEKIAGLLRQSGHKPKVLLYHEPVNIETAKKNGVNLQLAGHTHLGQQFPFNYFTRLVYGKYHYGLHYEKGTGHTLYTTNGVGTWGPSVRIGNRPEIVKIIFK